TTVIVGFPGETDDDFQRLLDLLEELRIERVGAFTYSVEEGTPAADYPGQVSESLARERLEELMERQARISLEANLEQVGTTRTALIDHATPDDPDFAWVARTAGQALDVDGVTRILRDGSASAPEPRPGDFVRVAIEDAEEHDLVARLPGPGE
ncbi:MAG: 30S ribosomal protein S12 methylthiotransferase RimO, partial [Gemmatimonadetes bacterium]|nr:30S ribosomal protein S12 methylthiotransferase RimO [Gemmatimonadota bacterium]